MEQGLFGKYAVALSQRKNKQEEIIAFIEKETGVILGTEEIVLQKNNISFQTSSVKKVLLRKKSIEDFLKEKGYIIKR
jgi:hypothetical protein